MSFTPENRRPAYGRLGLIMRALEEDHMAIKACSDEERMVHHAMADLLRKRADDLLTDAPDGDSR